MSETIDKPDFFNAAKLFSSDSIENKINLLGGKDAELKPKEEYWNSGVKTEYEEQGKSEQDFAKDYNDIANDFVSYEINTHTLKNLASTTPNNFKSGLKEITVTEGLQNAFAGMAVKTNVINNEQYFALNPIKPSYFTGTGRYRVGDLTETGFSERHLDARAMALNLQNKITGDKGQIIINDTNRKDFVDFVLNNEKYANEEGKLIKAIDYDFSAIDFNSDWSSFKDIPLFKAVYTGDHQSYGERVNYFDAKGYTTPSIESDASEAVKGVTMSILKAPVSIYGSISDMFRAMDFSDEWREHWERHSTFAQDFGAGKSIEGQQSFFTADNIAPFIADVAIQVLISRGAGLAGSALGKALVGTKTGQAANFVRNASAAVGTHGTMAAMATHGSYDRALKAGYSEDAAKAYMLMNFGAIATVSRGLDWFTALPVSKRMTDLAAFESRLLADDVAKLHRGTASTAKLSTQATTQAEIEAAAKSAKKYTEKFTELVSRYKPGTVEQKTLKEIVKNSMSESMEEYSELFAEVVIDQFFNTLVKMKILETGTFETGWDRLVSEEAALSVVGGFFGGTFAALTMKTARPTTYKNHLANSIIMGQEANLVSKVTADYKAGKLGPTSLTVNKVPDGKGNLRFETVAEAKSRGEAEEDIITLNDYAYKIFQAELAYTKSIINSVGIELDESYKTSPLLAEILDNSGFSDRFRAAHQVIVDATVDIDAALKDKTNETFAATDLANVPAAPSPSKTSPEEMAKYKETMRELSNKYAEVPGIAEKLNEISLAKATAEKFSSEEGQLEHLRRTSIELQAVRLKEIFPKINLDDFYDEFMAAQALTKQLKIRGEAQLDSTAERLNEDIIKLVDSYQTISSVDDLLNLRDSLSKLKADYGGFLTKESLETFNVLKEKLNGLVGESIIKSYDQIIADLKGADPATVEKAKTLITQFFNAKNNRVIDEDALTESYVFLDSLGLDVDFKTGELSIKDDVTTEQLVKIIEDIKNLGFTTKDNNGQIISMVDLENMFHSSNYPANTIFSFDETSAVNHTSAAEIVYNFANSWGVDQSEFFKESVITRDSLSKLTVDEQKINALKDNLKALNTYNAFFHIIDPKTMSVDGDSFDVALATGTTPLHALVEEYKALTSDIEGAIPKMAYIQDLAAKINTQLHLRNNQLKSINALIRNWGILEFQSNLVYTYTDPKEGKVAGDTLAAAYTPKKARQLSNDFLHAMQSDEYSQFAAKYNSYIDENVGINPSEYFNLKRKLLGVDHSDWKSYLNTSERAKQRLLSVFFLKATPAYKKLQAEAKLKAEFNSILLSEILNDPEVRLDADNNIVGLDKYDKAEVAKLFKKSPSVNNLSKAEINAYLQQQKGWDSYSKINDAFSDLGKDFYEAYNEFQDNIKGIDLNAFFQVQSRRNATTYYINMFDIFLDKLSSEESGKENFIVSNETKVKLKDISAKLQAFKTLNEAATNLKSGLEIHRELMTIRQELRTILDKETNSDLENWLISQFTMTTKKSDTTVFNELKAASLMLLTDEEAYYTHVKSIYGTDEYLTDKKKILWNAEQELHGLLAYGYIKNKNFVSKVLTSPKLDYLFLEGVPGSGKTTVVSNIINGLEDNTVFYTAPDLPRSININSKQPGYSTTKNYPIAEDLIKSNEFLKALEDAKKADTTVTLVIDEATLMKYDFLTKDLHNLITKYAGTLKVILLGDTAQITVTTPVNAIQTPKLNIAIRARVGKITKFFKELDKNTPRGFTGKGDDPNLQNFATVWEEQNSYATIRGQGILGGVATIAGSETTADTQAKVDEIIDTLKGKTLEVMIVVDSRAINEEKAKILLEVQKRIEQKEAGLENITVTTENSLANTMGKEADYVLIHLPKDSFNFKRADGERTDFKLFNTVMSRARYFTLAIDDAGIGFKTSTQDQQETIMASTDAIGDTLLEDKGLYREFLDIVAPKVVVAPVASAPVTSPAPSPTPLVIPTLTPDEYNTATENFTAEQLVGYLKSNIKSFHKFDAEDIPIGSVVQTTYTLTFADGSSVTEIVYKLDDDYIEGDVDIAAVNLLKGLPSHQDIEDFLIANKDNIKNDALANLLQVEFDKLVAQGIIDIEAELRKDPITIDFESVEESINSLPSTKKDEAERLLKELKVQKEKVAIKHIIEDESLEEFGIMAAEEVVEEYEKITPKDLEKVAEKGVYFYGTPTADALDNTSNRMAATNAVLRENEDPNAFKDVTPWEDEADAIRYNAGVHEILTLLANGKGDFEAYLVVENVAKEGKGREDQSNKEVINRLQIQIVHKNKLYIFDSPVRRMMEVKNDKTKAILEIFKTNINKKTLLTRDSLQALFKVNPGALLTEPSSDINNPHKFKQRSYTSLREELESQGYTVNGPYVNTNTNSNKRGEVFITYRLGSEGKEGRIYLNSPVLKSYEDLTKMYDKSLSQYLFYLGKGSDDKLATFAEHFKAELSRALTANDNFGGDVTAAITGFFNKFQVSNNQNQTWLSFNVFKSAVTDPANKDIKQDLISAFNFALTKVNGLNFSPSIEKEGATSRSRGYATLNSSSKQLVDTQFTTSVMEVKNNAVVADPIELKENLDKLVEGGGVNIISPSQSMSADTKKKEDTDEETDDDSNDITLESLTSSDSENTISSNEPKVVTPLDQAIIAIKELEFLKGKEIQPYLDKFIADKDLDIDCSGITKGANGWKQTFTPGGSWEIITKFDGPKHSQGGIDIQINDGKISLFKQGGTLNYKDFGLVLPNIIKHDTI